MDYGNFLSSHLSTILLGLLTLLLFSMVAYVLRDINFNTTSVTYHNQKVTNLEMTVVKNPFVLNLLNTKENPEYEVTLIVSCTMSDCILSAFWNVSISSLHRIIYLDWDILKEELRDGRSLLGESGIKSPVQNLSKGSLKKEIFLKPPRLLDALEIGLKPRKNYPLVVFLHTQNNEYERNQVVASIHIFHLKDSVCNMDSKIVYTYLKQQDGRATLLKPIYASSGDEGTYNEQIEPTQINCTVCLLNEATLVLLPCRHNCICESCFPRVKSCPLCREHIVSYFYKLKTQTSTS